MPVQSTPIEIKANFHGCREPNTARKPSSARKRAGLWSPGLKTVQTHLWTSLRKVRALCSEGGRDVHTASAENEYAEFPVLGTRSP